MFGFGKNDPRAALVGRLHTAIVESSRAPDLYGEGGLPDSVEGRFESLTLHILIVLRRLRALPAPAAEVAQELIDAFFAHLEIALRESGIGDFGIPKRIKKLGQAFYERTALHDAALDAGDAAALAEEIGRRLAADPAVFAATARYAIEAERRMSDCDLDRLLAGPPFAPIAAPYPTGAP